MNAQVKKAVKSIIRAVVNVSGKTRLGQHLHGHIANMAMEKVAEIPFGGMKFRFAVPNSLCGWRAKTFATKEPETLAWIDSIPAGAIFWDIGANVGLYSVYAAKKRNCRVWAFEPSVFNVELLARNIFLNGVNDRVCLVPLALSNGCGPNLMHMTTTDWGGALSTFGQDYGWDGRKVDWVFQFQTLGMSADEAMQKFRLPQPDYIKIDVDGIEHLILRGATAVLSSVKSVLIEVNDSFEEQADQCRSMLMESGLVLKEKRRSEMFSSSDSFGGGLVWNQIWVRTQTQ